MSISEFFNKKARTAVAATALALGAAGGFAGYEAGHNFHAPQPSEFTLSNAPQDLTDAQFYAGKVPAGKTVDRTAENAAVETMTARIDGMAAQRAEVRSLEGAIGLSRVFPSLPMAAEQQRAAQVLGDLNDKAASFVNDLRLNTDLSGKDYQSLLADYNRRVGLDVTSQVGNYRTGAEYIQAAQVGEAMENMFSGLAHHDDDMSVQDQSREVGDFMLAGEHQRDLTAAAGATGGMLLGGLVLLPLYMRRRKDQPQVFKGKTPKA